MRLMTMGADATPSFSKLSLSLATTPEEVREVQRLRYQVFVEAMGLETLQNSDGLERDEFDDYCDHLIVRDSYTLKVVGTYRVMGARALAQTGRFYSESEFDLTRLQNLRPRILEAGRACIHPDYRSGGVIMMLWAGLAACMKKENAEYLVGCASVSLADGGNTMRLVANGPTGLLFINGQRVAELDLSGQTESGLLDLVTGFTTGNEIEGRATGYSGATLYISE